MRVNLRELEKVVDVNGKILAAVSGSSQFCRQPSRSFSSPPLVCA